MTNYLAIGLVAFDFCIWANNLVQLMKVLAL